MEQTNHSQQKLQDFLAQFCWDIELDESLLPDLLDGNIETLGGLDRANLFAKLLTGTDWYTLLKIIPDKDLNYLLSDNVLNRLFPKELKELYLYARRLL